MEMRFMDWLVPFERFRQVMKVDSIIYNPLEVSTLGTDYLRFRHDHKDLALQFPVKSMREKVYPLAGGEVMSIIARPGHMKTGLMMFWARQRANLLKEIEGRI